MLSQTADYALRAAAAIATQHPTAPTHDQLAAATNIPPQYLYKVLQILARAGILRAARGRNGGYALARPPYTITWLDVLRAASPGRAPASTELPQPVASALARLEITLSATTLSHIAPDQSQPLTLRHPPPTPSPATAQNDWACWNARAG